MEAKAIARHIHQSPRKIRKTQGNVRGLKVGDALNQLHFSPEKAASVIEKTLRSAVSNLMSQNDELNIKVVKTSAKTGDNVENMFTNFTK